MHPDSARERVKAGGDPIAEKRPVAVAKPAVVTFGEAVSDYIAADQATWRNAKHREQHRRYLCEAAHGLASRSGGHRGGLVRAEAGG